jgi:hypothetical protein
MKHFELSEKDTLLIFYEYTAVVAAALLYGKRN